MGKRYKEIVSGLLRVTLYLTVLYIVSVAGLLQGCGGSGGADNPASEDPARDYYDQLWDFAKASVSPNMMESEIAEALARWVVNNSTNASLWVSEDAQSLVPESAFRKDGELLPFEGLCSDRSYLFKYLGERAGLTVSIFNMYNFGGVGGGHTCVQVYYNGDWHFYDVTYAGMFVSNGEVLSFTEMRADPQSALLGMVVFEPAGDIRDYYSNGSPVDNGERMEDVYTVDALTSAISTSFLGSGNVVPLEVHFDLSLVPINLGDADGASYNILSDGIDQGISECMDVMLGRVWDNFEPRIELKNAVSDQEYALRFYAAHSTEIGLIYQVSEEGAVNLEVASGEEFVTPSYTDFVWEIVFRPRGPTASFRIYTNCAEGQGLIINCVTLEKH
jgi:hypothetical protein